MHENHHSPYISILMGSFSGIVAYITDHGFNIQDFAQLSKVIVFAMIGGVFGYIGKLIAIRIHFYIKKL